MECTLEDILVFFSDADSIPPLGFEASPKLFFLHGEARLPTASTCGLHLRLPTMYTVYEDFKEAMVMGIIGNDGFGGV